MDYLFRPEDVDLSNGLSGTFGKAEVEASACMLVKFCKYLRTWQNFTLEEYERFVTRERTDEGRRQNYSYHFLFGLIGQWHDDGGPGSLRDAPVQALICWGHDWSVSTAFLERIKDHVKKGKNLATYKVQG